MKSFANKKLVYLASLLLAGLFAVPANGEEVQFEHHDFQKALKAARENDLPMIVHFSTTWCGPCQMMEHNVFKKEQLKSSLQGKVILVKVDGDRFPDLVRMYRVAQYPTDVFLDPHGRVLKSSSNAQSLNHYISQALQVEQRYQQSRKIFASRKKSGNDPAPTSDLDVRLGEPGPFPDQKRTPQIAKTPRDKNSKPGVPDPRDPRSEDSEEKPESIYVAMDGFCPVSLSENREWVPGSKEHVVLYRQQQYHLNGEREKELFEQEPEKYAPRLIGCDPVIMWETDRAIPGSTQFAAYYNDSLYLFTSEENREIFEIDPERYTNTKHVLGPRDVEATLIR